MSRDMKYPFAPPENWYEPEGQSDRGYRVIVQEPGVGFQHVVTPSEINERLSCLDRQLVTPLETVQLSRMTRKKLCFPCYGMQWGSTLYLYPIEKGLVEFFDQAPRPAFYNEVRMYGGRWVQQSSRGWKLIWTEDTIRNFYLNNILIHELGHLLDERNSSYIDRERYAEWFAIEHGYRTSREQQQKRKSVSRRHHSA